MKIVHLVDYFMPQLGYQECLLAKYHAKKHVVTILTSDKYYPFPNYKESYQKMMGNRQQKTGEEEKNNYKINRLKSYFEIPSSTLILYKGILKELKKIKPDIIICHGLIKPTIFWACLYKRQNPQCRLIGDHHEAIYNTNLKDSFLKRVYLLLWKFFLKPRILRYADKLIATGPDEKDFAVKHLFGEKNADKIEIISLGADEEKFFIDEKKRNKMRKSFRLKDDDVLILNAGKLNQSKKSLELLEVFEKIHQVNPNTYLMFVGGGDENYLQKMRDFIKTKQLNKNVFLQSFIPNDKLPDYLNLADIGCWPGSRSNVFWEALACGLPLILEKRAYTEELISNDNGQQVENLLDLENTLRDFVVDKNLRKKMSQNSKELFQKKFSYTKLSEEFLSVKC